MGGAKGGSAVVSAPVRCVNIVLCACSFADASARIYINMHTHTHTHTHCMYCVMCMFIDMYTWRIYTCTHVRIYAYTHIHTYTLYDARVHGHTRLGAYTHCIAAVCLYATRRMLSCHYLTSIKTCGAAGIPFARTHAYAMCKHSHTRWYTRLHTRNTTWTAHAQRCTMERMRARLHMRLHVLVHANTHTNMHACTRRQARRVPSRVLALGAQTLCAGQR